jgi:hypothetical protein
VPDERVVPLAKLEPARISQLRGTLRRPHDVREENGGKHPLVLGFRLRVDQESLDLERRLVTARRDARVEAGQLDRLRVGYPARHIEALLAKRPPIEDERRNADCRQDVADVCLHRHPEVRVSSSRAGPETRVPNEVCEEALIVGKARVHR